MPKEGTLKVSIEVPRPQVLRYMGYPRSATPTLRVAEAIERLWPQAVSLLRPRGAYRVVTADEVAAAKMPDPTARVAAGLCTIGPDIERAAQQAQPLEALFFDAFGSAAAEACADGVNHRVCQRAHELGLNPRPRISPGYGRWNVQNQAALLALLPAEDLDIQLTSGMMMTPRKSVSFVVRLANAPKTEDPSAPRRCARCGLLDCPYRRETRDADSG